LPTRIEITLQCRALKQSNILSRPNSFCVLYGLDPNHHHYDTHEHDYPDDPTSALLMMKQESSSSLSRRRSTVAGHILRNLLQLRQGEHNDDDASLYNGCATLEGEYEIGRTEVISNTSSPNFSIRIQTDYNFQQEQIMVLRVFDNQGYNYYNDDYDNHDDDQAQYLGGTTFTLGQLLGSPGNTLGRPLIVSSKGQEQSQQQQQQNGGSVIIQAEEVMLVEPHNNVTYGSRDILQLRLSASNLKNTDRFLPSFFGGGKIRKSDPFFRLERKDLNHKLWQSIGVSEIIHNDLNPKWNRMDVPLQQVCNGNLYRKLRIKIQDWDGMIQTPDDLGCVETTIPHLLTKPTYKVMRYSSRHHVCVPKGELHVLDARIIPQPTMVEYLTGGCQIKLHVAIDFGIGSKERSPNWMESLHSLDNDDNVYSLAIESIGNILAPYHTSTTSSSSSEGVSMWGFGAKLHGTHYDAFPIGLRKDNNDANDDNKDDNHIHKPQQEQQCHASVDSLVNAYQQCLKQPGFELSDEPTRMASVIEHVMKDATMRKEKKKEKDQKPQEEEDDEERQEQKYNVLCILTDGCISDMAETVEMICEASKKETGPPLSIIIVGLGEHGNFDDMVLLDNDRGQLQDLKGGHGPERDIVQFVPFRDYAHDPMKLAEETLYEVPDQLIEYFTSKEIYPNPPLSVSTFGDDDYDGSSKNEDDEQDYDYRDSIALPGF